MFAYMSWDWDIDEEKRKDKPHFYGYIPKKSLVRKVVIATSLFVCSVCCLLVRSLICISLAQKGLGVVAAVLASEMLIFFVAKAFVGHLTYLVPIYGIFYYLLTYFTHPIWDEDHR